jgi:hypothetical protein
LSLLPMFNIPFKSLMEGNKSDELIINGVSDQVNVWQMKMYNYRLGQRHRGVAGRSWITGMIARTVSRRWSTRCPCA